jgi:hypothetical protein
VTTNRQFDDSEGDFGQWQDYPQACNRPILIGIANKLCGAKVQVRSWESSDGAYTDYQYRCANGHTWWIDGIDS